MKKATGSSETSAHFYLAAWYYMLEENNLRSHCCEDFKSDYLN
jgi:hypothetical protein